MAKKETFKQAGYQYLVKSDDGSHCLWNDHTGKRETWANNKNHASYGLIYKNTHLEFVREV